MSETPRLSRRELRELGKLQARPADSESTTDITELHLHRPSRKEMRELEKAQTGTFEAIKVDAENAAPVNEAPEETVSVPVHSDAPTGVSGNSASAAKESPAIVASPVTESSEDAESDVVEQSETDAVKAEEEEKPKRTSVFKRFKSRHEDETAEDSEVQHSDNEEQGVADTPGSSSNDTQTPSSTDTPVATAATEDSESDDGDPSDRMRSRLLEMTKRHGVADAADDAEESDVPAAVTRTSVIDPEAKEAGYELAPTAPTAAMSTVNEPAVENYEDDEAPSGRRTLLNYLLLLIIATLIGLLIGQWINATFLADGASASNAAATFAILRL